MKKHNCKVLWYGKKKKRKKNNYLLLILSFVSEGTQNVTPKSYLVQNFNVNPIIRCQPGFNMENTKILQSTLSQAHDCECGWPNYGGERGLACRNPLSSINPTVLAALKGAVSSFVLG